MSHPLQYILLAMAVVLAAAGCSEQKEIPRTTLEKFGRQKAPDQISRDVEVFFVDSSYTKARLTANVARIYQEEKKTYLDGQVKVEFLSAETKQRTTLMSCDSAEIDDRTKNMLAKGNVLVWSDSSRTKLETSVLHWDNKTQLFYSTEFVTIDSPEEKIQGYGFESDQNLKYYRIFKVSGEQK